MSICNQYFVNDEHRDKRVPMQVRCVFCGEQSSLPKPFPIELELMTDYIELFVALHRKKGCNHEQLHAPQWA